MLVKNIQKMHKKSVNIENKFLRTIKITIDNRELVWKVYNTISYTKRQLLIIKDINTIPTIYSLIY